VITEHIMRPGSWELRFRPSVPAGITSRILSLVQGVGCHVVITPVRVDPAAIGDAATLAAATYTLRVTERPSRLSLKGKGLSSWLDSYNDVEISRTAGTPSNWLSDLLVNGLTAGTVSGGSNVTRLFPAWGQFRREALDVVAGLGGWEYEVRPNFTVNAGTSVWSTTPTVVITDRNEGPDGALTGLVGGLLDQEISIADQATKAGTLVQGDGPGIAVGQATQSIPLKDRSGNTPVLVTVLSAPSEQRGNETTLATNYLNLRKLKRAVKVSTTTRHARRFVRPGDYVWLYDVKSGLVDTANQILYRGEVAFPLKVRVTSMSSPIEAGSGVYIRSNAASPEYIDVTDHMAWEPPGAFLDVGEWSPPVYGRANRSDPEVEARVAPSPFIAATLLNSWVTFGLSLPAYRLVGDEVKLAGLVQSGTSASAVIMTLPVGYRPVAEKIMAARSFAGAAEIRIATNGNVSFASGGSTTWNSMDGVSFPIT
jgi:hypothetical protein